MKKEGHPDYNPVVFVDVSTNREFPTRSTLKSKETKVIDGVEHFVIRREVTMDSHPAYTGETRFVDTAGRVDKFQQRAAKTQAAQAAVADAAAAKKKNKI